MNDQLFDGAGIGQTTERIGGYVTQTALHDLISGIATDLLCATTTDELQQVAGKLRVAADQVEGYAAQQRAKHGEGREIHRD